MRRVRQLEIRLESVRQRNRKKKKNGQTLKRDKWTERDHEIRYYRDK